MDEFVRHSQDSEPRRHMPPALAAFALSTHRLAAFVPAGGAGARPALEPRAPSLALLRSPAPSAARRPLASRSSAIMDGSRERVLPRPWWPEEGTGRQQRVQPAGPAQVGDAAGALRFVLELAARLDPVAAAAFTAEATAGASQGRGASVAVVLRLSQRSRCWRAAWRAAVVRARRRKARTEHGAAHLT
jgi:hypothetical protein